MAELNIPSNQDIERSIVPRPTNPDGSPNNWWNGRTFAAGATLKVYFLEGASTPYNAAIVNAYAQAAIYNSNFQSIANTADRQRVMDNGFAAIARQANINFVVTTDMSQADIRVGLGSGTAGLGTSDNWAVPKDPSNPSLGYWNDVFIDPTYLNARGADGQGFDWFSPGRAETMTLLHEIGHAIGLQHPTVSAPGVNGGLSAAYTDLVFAVMNGGYVPYAPAFMPTSPMLFDAVGLQSLYGLRPQGTGNNQYRLDSAGGANSGAVVPTGKLIIDNGANDSDTLIAGYVDQNGANQMFATDCELDLRATDFAAGKTYLSRIGTPAGRYNVAIYEGTTIENALGGSGNDTITGNDAANSINGGSGNDLLQGGAGSDTYVFDAGWGNDKIVDSDGQGSIVIAGTSMSGTMLRAGKGASGTWKDASGLYTFNWKPGANGRGDLVISKRSSTSNAKIVGVVTVRNFANGELGITLSGTDRPVPPSAPVGSIKVYFSDPLIPGTAQFNGTAVPDYESTNLREYTDTSAASRWVYAPEDGGQVIALGDGNNYVDVARPYVGPHDEQWGPGLGEDEDFISTGSGSDTIRSGYGSDFIASGGGNDWIFSAADGVPQNHDVADAAGGDIVDAGSGDDNLWGSMGSDILFGGDGNDGFFGMEGADLLIGGDGNDGINGDGVYTSDQQLFEQVVGALFGYESGGDDSLFGGGGDDRLIGGVGKDYLDGGDGNDSLFGDTDSVYVAGGNMAWIPGEFHRDDYLDGGAGDDFLLGGGGADTLIGGQGADLVYADQYTAPGGELGAQYHGRDYVDGGEGDDSLYGQGGADTLVGGTGINFLYGGDGDDLIVSSGAADVLDGGLGRDTLRVARGTQATLAASTSSVTLDADVLVLEGSSSSAAGILMSAVPYSPTSQVATLTFADSSTSITLSTQGANSVLGDSLESITFADGVTWSQADLRNHLRGTATAGNDELWALNGLNESLDALAGDDKVHGANGNDTLVGGTGRDFLWGNDGDDLLDGGDGNDPLYGGNGNDTVMGGAGDDLSLFGDGGNDVIDGGSGEDWIEGGDGDDTIIGGAGNDAMRDFGSTSNDVYRYGIGDGYDLIDDRGGNNDRVELGVGVTPASVRVGVSPFGGPGFLHLMLNDVDHLMVGTYNSETGVFDPSRVVETVQFSDGTQWDLARLKAEALKTTSGNDQVQGFAEAEVIDGGDGDDTLNSSAGNDVLYGGNGADRLDGGYGNDSLYGGAGDDWIVGGYWGGDIFEGGTGADFLIGGRDASDVYRFNVGDGADQIQDDGGTDDRIEFGAGITAASLISIENENGSLKLALAGGDSITVYNMFDIYAGGLLSDPGIDRIVFGDGTSWNAAAIDAELLRRALITTAGDDVRRLSAGNDTIDGGGGNDSLYGLNGDDNLSGGDGNDTLYGGNGNDLIAGGAGNDTLEGEDGDDFLLGGDGADALRGGYGDDTLDGGAGNDDLSGLVGNDVYLFGKGDGQDTVGRDYGGSAGSVLRLKAGLAPSEVVLRQVEDSFWGGMSALELSIAGTPDKVTISKYFGVSFPTIHQIEFSDGTVWDADRIAQEVAANMPMTLFGTEQADTLVGSGGDDTLDGLGGMDTLIGKMGNDIYYVDNIADVVVEAAYAGTDTIVSSVSWTLSEQVENLTLAGTSAIHGFGNAAANQLRGNGANNLLDGGAGNDTLLGGAGDDIYRVDSSGDSVTELAGEGIDSVESSVTWTLGAELENLTLMGAATINGTGNSLDNRLIGNAANNSLTGGAGNDRLDGGQGIDTMVGGSGNDTYVVDNSSDVVTESSNAGIDSVESSANFTLGSNVENLTLTGTASINATGNTLANALTGNSGANILSGGSGADTMTGGAGDDTYVVDNAGDVVVEAAGGGIDIIQSGVTWTLGSDVENLTLTGSSAINGTGNTLDNMLTGNGGNNTLTGGAGNDTLDGGAGTDTMIGGAGDDTYVVERTADVVTEAAGEGTDTVRSTVTLTLGSNVENLTLTGTSAINATGNTLSNVLIGNGAANTLSGGTGNDTMIGGAGDDIYVVDAATDVVTEATGEGTDTVQSAVTWTLGAEVENLTLAGSSVIDGTGNSLNNVLTGNGVNNTLTGGAGNDTLDGGVGNDTMAGGTGNDTYVVNVSTDVVTEAVSEGIDTVQSVVTWTLGSNVENLTLTGSSTISGTGNTLDNVLVGNSANNTLTGLGGNDTLDGGAGNDTMLGGTGDDTYVVNVSTDVVTENASEGTDTIQSAVTLTLGNNVENLTLTGTSAINATGNTLANTLLGNSGANVLTGAAGDDIYDGGAGNDTFTDSVTSSNDTYRWGIGSGLDTLTDAGGSLDHIDLYAGIAKSQLKFVQNANDLELSVIGQTDKLTIKNWYVGTANQIEEFRLSDGSKVLASEVNGLLSAMAAFVPMDSSTGSQAKTGLIDMPISNPNLPQQAWM